MTHLDTATVVGHVAAIHRYPVKSMRGEGLDRAAVGPMGIDGDRRFAVIDAETGRVASAKNPKKWGALLGYRAVLRGGELVVIAPDGEELKGDPAGELSRRLGRRVTLAGVRATPGEIEIDWPDVAGLSALGTETVEPLPSGGYFDTAPLHLLTTATLARYRELVPGCDFDVRRFRPNLVIEPLPELGGFVEGGWVGRRVRIGDATLRITAPCTRCVMTTLPADGLPPDPCVLRAVVAHNSAAAGVLAEVVATGQLAVGTPVLLGRVPF
jgi:hypothetical protein